MKQGWENKSLKEVAEYSIGLTYAPDDVNDSGIIVLRSSNIQNDKIDLSDIVRVNKKIKENLVVKEGDILMCSRNGSKRLVGKTATISKLNEKMTFGTFMTIIRSPFNSYLAWFFKSDLFRDQLGIGENTMINQVTKYMLDDITVPVPPLSEQKRIVAILDEAFAAIDKARANAEKNLQNAKELFESYLIEIFERKRKGWEEKSLNEVCIFKPQKKEAREILKATDFVTFLPMEDLGILTKEVVGVKQRRLKEVEGSYTYFANNDVLMAKITPCFENGKIGVVRNLINGIGFGSSEYIVFRTKGSIEPDYLYYFLSQSKIREEGKKLMKGSVGHKRVSKEWIENYKISFPKSTEEQKVIVQELSTLSNNIKALESVQRQKISDLEELKKSILQKAFSGELKTKEVKEFA